VKQKKILILCYSDLQRDPRVRRHIEALKGDYDIITCGYAPPKDMEVSFISCITNEGQEKKKTTFSFHLRYFILVRKIISALLLLYIQLIRITSKISQYVYLYLHLGVVHHFDYRYWTEKEHGRQVKILERLRKQKFDLILANDLQTLPLALKLAKDKNVKVVYDAHEYTPLEGEGMPEWVTKYQDYYTYLCKKYLPQTAAMFTVCEGIAQEYHKNFGVKPLVLTNATTFYDLKPQSITDKIKIIHHGIAGAARRLDLLIELMDYLDERFALDLMLMNNNPVYLEELKQSASHNPRIKFITTVATQEIPVFSNQYDIGIFLLPFTNFNYHFALPNKFFEFIQARLMIAIGPSPEMQKITEKYDLGIVATDFDPKTLARKLNELTTEQIMYYKHQSHKFAYELSAESNKKLLKQTIDNLF
jgi:hypothetical protein